MINRLRTSVASQQNWFFAIAAISMTPLIQALFTSTLDGYVTYPQALIRVLSLVTILTDTLIVAMAMKLGFLRYIRVEVSVGAKITFAGLFTVALLSVFAHEGQVLFSLFITLRFFLQLAVLFSLIHILASSHAFDANRYFTVMASGAVFYVAYLVLVIAMIPEPATFQWSGGLPSATSVRHIGNYVAILLLAAVGLFLLLNDRRRWIALGVIFVVTVFLAWTGSRAAFLGLTLALAVAIYVVRGTVSASRISILSVTCFAAMLATVLLPVPDSSFGIMRMISASGARQHSDISSGRTVVWKHTIDEIAAAPIIGHGSGRFLGNMDAKYRYDLDNPHNFVLQFAYDWGIAGLAIALLLLMLGGVKMFILPIVSPLATFCAVSGLMLMLSIGMLEGMFYHPLKMLLASALVAPAFALARQQQTPAPAFC